MLLFELSSEFLIGSFSVFSELSDALTISLLDFIKGGFNFVNFPNVCNEGLEFVFYSI